MKANHAVTQTSDSIPRPVIRSVGRAVRTQSGRPVMLRLEPVLMLLMMLRRQEPSHRLGRCGESRLPAGCVLVVRYQSH